MFKSFSDSIRSLWQSKTSETVKASARKRKRPLNDTDLDDSDVEIISVKKPRQGNTNSSSGLLSFLTIPMSRMSDWVKKKTVRQDHVFVQPIVQQNTHSRGDGDQQRLVHTSSVNSLNTNGSFAHLQNASRLSRLPLHNQNGAHENGVNGDVHIADFQPSVYSVSSSSSRRSSCSSFRPGRGRRSTVEQCFQLKEKEDYRRLLQQYTSIDLGYDAHRRTTKAAQGSPTRHCRMPGLGQRSMATALPSRESVGTRPRPGWERQTNSLSPGVPAWRTSLRGGVQGDEEREQQVDTSSPSSDSDPEVIIVEDTNGSTSGQIPSLNFKSSHYLDENWIERLNSRYASAERERQRLIEEAEIKKKILEQQREEKLGSLDRRLRQQMKLFDGEVEVIEDPSSPEEEQESRLPELTDAMQREIDAALGNGPQHQVLSEGFRLQLTRADFATLQGLNWLNDEVINFYMNLLMERGEQEGFCKTYAYNTFFYPKLIAGGHDAVKRWTRRVDIFCHLYLIVPVHLGVHWCLCVVFMKEKCIRYYDSMGGNNNQCLNAIRQYLYDESLQKRNIQLDLSEWFTETVKDIPQQMNGSDCGMFSCMYAETLTRGARVTFTQKDMPYFRRRMVYELLKKKLL